ncbi:discoidin domain-containing protein [Aliisedimentitalea scapharcae]|uniref:Discoidin domain-containing protein n=2 Tax=Aliisedimentitalea scapharcae TaxID=1524259 RepID=A0ABZ2XSH0_9RHOB
MRATPGGADQTSEAYASASSVWNGNSAERAFDASTATRWYAEAGYPCWIQQDFGVETTVQEVYLRSLLTSVAPVGFDIQKSDDGATWETTDSYSVASWPYDTGYEFAVTDASGPTELVANGLSVAPSLGSPHAQLIQSLHPTGFWVSPKLPAVQITVDREIRMTAAGVWNNPTVRGDWAVHLLNGIFRATPVEAAIWPATPAVPGDWQEVAEPGVWAQHSKAAEWPHHTANAHWEDVA